MKTKVTKRTIRKSLCIPLVVVVVAAVFLNTAIIQKAEAKTKVSDGTFFASSKYAYYSGASLFKKIKFSGNNVTFQGKFKVKVSGKKKTLAKLTLPVATNCKYYEAWDTGLHAVKKSTMRNYLQKGEFITLNVTVKSGKVIRFVNGA